MTAVSQNASQSSANILNNINNADSENPDSEIPTNNNTEKINAGKEARSGMLNDKDEIDDENSDSSKSNDKSEGIDDGCSAGSKNADGNADGKDGAGSKNADGNADGKDGAGSKNADGNADGKDGKDGVVAKKKREKRFSYVYLVWSESIDFVKFGRSHSSACRFRGRYKTVS